MSWVAVAIAGSAIVGGYVASESSKASNAAIQEASQSSNATQLFMFNKVWDSLEPYRDIGEDALGELRGLMGLDTTEKYISGYETKSIYPGAQAEADKLKKQLDQNPEAHAGGPIEDAYNDALRRAGQTQQAPIYGERTIKADTDSAMETLRNRPGYQFRLAEGTDVVEGGQAAKSNLLSGRAGKELMRFGQEFGSNEYDKEINRLTNVVNIGRGAQTESNEAALNTGGNISNITMSAGLSSAAAIQQGYAGINNAIQGGISNAVYYNAYQNSLGR